MRALATRGVKTLAQYAFYPPLGFGADNYRVCVWVRRKGAGLFLHDLGKSIAQIPLGSSHLGTTFDVSSPCILAVSSLSNSTARHVRLDTLVPTRSTRRTSRIMSRYDEPSGIWAYRRFLILNCEFNAHNSSNVSKQSKAVNHHH